MSRMKPIPFDESGRRDQEPDFNPRELRQLQRSLADLRFVAGPIKGRPETRSARAVDSPHPDQIRERQRLYLRRVLRHLAELSSDITVAIHENHYSLTPWDLGRRSCPSCQSRNRETARHCDHCGTRLPSVP